MEPKRSNSTQYEARVPGQVRRHTDTLLRSWVEDGRNDQEIESLVQSLVLNAYVEGALDLCEAAEAFAVVEARATELDAENRRLRAMLPTTLCGRCGGKGEVDYVTADDVLIWRRCPDCDGRRRVDG